MLDPDLMKKIRRRAYEIWEREGRPDGRARIHWLRAEAEFREELHLCQSSDAEFSAVEKGEGRHFRRHPRPSADRHIGNQ